MDLIAVALSPFRAVLRGAEHEAEEVLPVRDIEEIQTRVLDGVEAVRRATESIEKHVEVVETLAQSLPALTVAVEQLTVQLGGLLQVIAPIAGLERDVQKAEGFLFRRHRRAPEPPAAPSPAPPAAPSPAPPAAPSP